MKVTRVEVFDIHCPDRPAWTPVFVRIHTDEGISGVGEAGLAYDLGHSAAAAMIKEMAEAFLIGHDPFPNRKAMGAYVARKLLGLRRRASCLLCYECIRYCALGYKR